MNSEIKDVLLNGSTVDIALRDGKIASISPAVGTAQQVLLPLPVDPHVHLDKTFTANRCKPEKPGLFGAIEAMAKDALTWNETDLRERIGQALTEAYRNGMSAMRSHVDWVQEEAPLAWSVLGEMAQDWRGKVDIQRSSLTPLNMLGDVEFGAAIASRVYRDREVMGCFVYRNENVDALLEQVFIYASRYELMLDFHVDEGLEPEAAAFDRIVELTRHFRMSGRVLCGHACSLSIRPEVEVSRIISEAAESGIALTILPTTNLWLQDNQNGVTPRLRGLAPMHELRAAGVPVLLGADNVSDPFFSMGTYDALDVLRNASVAAHLVPADWLDSITTNPAKAMGLDKNEIRIGSSADFILIKGCSWDEALRNPKVPRQVFRAGCTESVGKAAA